MSKKSDFSTFNWFADPEEPGLTGLFEVSSIDKNNLSPYSKFESTVKAIEERLSKALNNKFGMFSESKKIIKQLYANFKKYSSKLPEHKLFESESKKDLKRMAEVEKLIESDNEKLDALCSKIYSKYKNEKDENKLPRIIKGDNAKNLFKGLDNLLKFAKDCVDKQSKLLIDDTKKGEKQFLGVDESGKAKYDKNKIEKLAKAFIDDKDIFGNRFILDFPRNETVKEYIKKRLSKTGKLLKDICKIINGCDKALDALDPCIKTALYKCKENDVSSCSYFKKIADDENNYNKYISQLNTAIDAYNILVGLLSSIVNYRGKMAKLISLYDPRVKEAISELVKKLQKQIGIYKKMKIILEEKMKRKSMKTQ
ncbi:MAG: hypothetical protein IJI84_00415 [Clostridia bacterium]|nr:hypothetical protein [Clostridia bacterium]